MIAKRIIPCLDIKNGRVVKGVNFVNLIDAGDPVELAKLYDDQNADELVFLDITASSDRRNIVLDLVERVANQVFIPFTVGGGIKTVEDMREILLAGAEKISINTAAIENPELLSRGAEKFGVQCVVLAVDAKRIQSKKGAAASIPVNKLTQDCLCDEESQFEIYIQGGRTATGIDAVKWAQKAEKLGAGEILLTSMDADGTKNGYDTALTSVIKKHTTIPIIASGGAGTIEHIKDILEVADAALLASLLHYGNLKVKDIKDYLSSHSINVRH
ncbi:MAG: imidazole glycerol phosphate synthase subunit HisF [Candidatus Margulisbacteria bacterium]|nr:imidazole glycerol phosphate synthase subunit HisF [Candidatus Margulisiibacteriota bacterium]